MPDIGMSFLRPIEAQQKMDMLSRSEPFVLAHQASLTRLQNAQATEAEMKVQQERAMAQMAGGLTGTPEEKLQKLADNALKVGAFGTAEKMMQMQATVALRGAQTASAQALAADRQLKDTQIRAKLAGDLAAAVERMPEDQRAAAWEQSIQVYEGMLGQKMPDQFRKYSSGLMGAIQAQSMTAYQQAEIQLREVSAAQKKKESDARIAAHRALEHWRETQAKKVETSPATKKANGTKPPGMVHKEEIDHAALAIEADPDLMKALPEKSDRSLFARDVAASAKAEMASVPGLDQGTAIQRAIGRLRGGLPPAPPADDRSLLERVLPEAMGGKAAPKAGRYRGAKPASIEAPAPGTVEDGYRFKGGDPADQKNWEKL